MSNVNQAAVLANLNNVSNALLAVKTACEGYRNLIAHFPPGALPATSADVQAVDDATSPLLALIQKDHAVEAEISSLE